MVLLRYFLKCLPLTLKTLWRKGGRLILAAYALRLGVLLLEGQRLVEGEVLKGVRLLEGELLGGELLEGKVLQGELLGGSFWRGRCWRGSCWRG